MIERTQIVIHGDLFRDQETIDWLVAKIGEAVAARDLVFIGGVKTMEGGKLRNRVELQRVSVARDSHGDQVKTWTTLATVWASVEPLSGREFFQASQVSSDVTVRIKIRGRSDITLTPKDRVQFGSRVFDIRHVIDWGARGVETQLLCTEHF